LPRPRFGGRLSFLMKIKVAVVILALAVLALTIGLIKTSQDSAEQQKKDQADIVNLSNGWSQTSAELGDYKETNLVLFKQIGDENTHITQLSNDLTQANDNLAQKDAALKTAMEQAAKRDAQIADLESTNEALDKQEIDLKISIANLDTQIVDTQKKLDASEGDKAFLEKELARMTAEKADLERKFNDLAVLRSQVKKLKEELDVSRRLEWMREGVYAQQDQKGAQRLMQNSLSANTKAASTNNYDLNVEVKSDGSVQVIPPITNAPASNSAPGMDPMAPLK
jgi:chromosome segregation ATPase